jgi:hypothetical protein
MDLPAELRCRIYGELLFLRSRYSLNPRTCWPQILRVSKAVYVEAEEVLYADN